MYIEIIKKAVDEYLITSPNKNIEINLTPCIHETVMTELNNLITINGDVIIQEIGISYIKINKRTVTLIKSNTLDYLFEKYLVTTMMTKIP